MDECIDSLVEPTIFWTLDANSRYWKVEIAAQDCDKMAFTSHHGSFRFTRVPFRLKNAPETFKRAMDGRPAEKGKMAACHSFLDDIGILSQTPDQHINHVRKVLTLLNEASVTLHLKKCEFFTNRIDCLGNVIRQRRLEVSTRTINAVGGLEHPTKLTELRSFFGLCIVF